MTEGPDEPPGRLRPVSPGALVGLALVGTGAGLVVAGAVLIAVDQTVLRKRRERGTSTTALVPTLSPYGAGLAWVGRF